MSNFVAKKQTELLFSCYLYLFMSAFVFDYKSGLHTNGPPIKGAIIPLTRALTDAIPSAPLRTSVGISSHVNK